MPFGPCIVCGEMDYPLSMGGPTICPACDCGNFGMERIKRQGKRIHELEKELAKLGGVADTTSINYTGEGYIIINNRRYPDICHPGQGDDDTDQAWKILDTIKDGIIPDHIRAFLAGMIIGALKRKK